MELFLICALLLALAAVAVAAIWLWLDRARTPLVDETARIREDASQAAWQIQRQASEAFRQMLKAVRDTRDPEDWK